MCCLSFVCSSHLLCGSRCAAAGQCAGHALLLGEVFACCTVVFGRASPGLACGQPYLCVSPVTVTNSPPTRGCSELLWPTSSLELMC